MHPETLVSDEYHPHFQLISIMSFKVRLAVSNNAAKYWSDFSDSADILDTCHPVSV